MKSKNMFLYLLFVAIFVLSGCQAGGNEVNATQEIAESEVSETVVAEATSVEPTEDVGKQIDLTAVLSEVEGEVIAKQANENDFSEVSNGFVLNSLGQVSTGFESKTRLDISDGSIVRLGANAVFTLEYGKEIEEGTNTKLELYLGQIWIILKGGSIDVDTESGVASVRGSFLGLSVGPNGEVYATCYEGDCYVATATGVIHFTAGQTVLITGLTDLPTPGYMTQEEIDEFMANNPEAEAAYATHLAQKEGQLPDDDFDGVPNEDDNCPDQGDIGFGVDENGCPNPIPPGDADGDNVQNADDDCPFLGDLGYGVDSVGCPNPPLDQDGDGYPDVVDACPDEGNAGFGLDAYGCPLSDPDPDGDEVLGDDDLCPGEGDEGYGVDEVGCPNPPPTLNPDIDGDGVPNIPDEDHCPTKGPSDWGLTPKGCPKKKPDGPPPTEIPE